jgi:type IV secretory pathway TraG/TraD family ATPase VirD4
VRQILKNSRSKDARALGATFVANASGDPKLVAWIMTGMATRFMVLRNSTVRDLMASDQDPHRNLSFIELINRPQALFLLIPAQHVDRLKPITACLIMQLMNHLTRSQVTRPFAFYLDELCNAGRIPHYERHISLVRAQGMALFQMIQDFGQLRRVYGPNEARTILSCSNTKIFFPGVGKEEAEYASELLGETTVKTSSIQRGRSGISERVSYASRRLMTADEVRRMSRRELLVIASNVAPMRLRSRPYFRSRRLRRLTALPQVYTNPHAQAANAGQQKGQLAASQNSSQAGGSRHKMQHIIQIVHRRGPGGPGQAKP